MEKEYKNHFQKAMSEYEAKRSPLSKEVKILRDVVEALEGSEFLQKYSRIKNVENKYLNDKTEFYTFIKELENSFTLLVGEVEALVMDAPIEKSEDEDQKSVRELLREFQANLFQKLNFFLNK